jgi:hypothetical protein
MNYARFNTIYHYCSILFFILQLPLSLFLLLYLENTLFYSEGPQTDYPLFHSPPPKTPELIHAGCCLFVAALYYFQKFKKIYLLTLETPVSPPRNWSFECITYLLIFFCLAWNPYTKNHWELLSADEWIIRINLALPVVMSVLALTGGWLKKILNQQ